MAQDVVFTIKSGVHVAGFRVPAEVFSNLQLPDPNTDSIRDQTRDWFSWLLRNAALDNAKPAIDQELEKIEDIN